MNNLIRKNDVCADALVYRDHKKLELSNDFILPDYLADIKSILYIKPTIHRSSFIISENKLEYDGELTYSVVFITEDDCIRSTVFEDEYNGIISVEGIKEDTASAIVLPKITEFSHKLSNPRKMNIKTTVELDVSVYNKRCITPHITGRHTLEDEMMLEKLEEEIAYIKCCIIEDSDVAVSEDILLDSSYPNITELLVCTLDPYINDMRVLNNKLLYRGEIIAGCLYTNAMEEGGERYYTITKKIPIEGELDIDTDIQKDNYRYKITASRPKAEARNNEFEERRIIELDFTYDLQLLCCAEEKITGVADAYSIDCEYKNTFTEYELLKKKNQTAGNLSINEMLSAKEIGADHTEDIITSSAILRNVQAEYIEQKGKAVCTAEITFDLCIRQDGGTLKPISFTRPIKFDIDGAGYDQSMNFSIHAAVVFLKCRNDENSYYADAEIGYTVSGEQIAAKSVLDTVELNKTEQSDPQGGAYPITLYYPGKNEALWDIAKKYNTTSQSIRMANDLAEDSLSDIGVLVIPRGKIKPVYTKII